MFASFGTSFFLFALTTSSLLQSSVVFGLTPYTYVRVELDPEVSSIKANCTAAFKKKLEDKVSDWIDSGLSIYFGAYSNQNLNFSVTYQSGWHNRRDLKELIGANRPKKLRASAADNTPSLSSSSSVAKAMTDNTPAKVAADEDISASEDNIPHDRALCSLTTCLSCCLSRCLVLCGCQRCGSSRMLLDEAINNRDLQTSTTWTSVNSIVTSSFQILAGLWLYQNDATDCMGNPWKVTAMVTFV